MQETGWQMLERMNKAIENSEQNVKQVVISAATENYKNFLSANVTYHLQLRNMTEHGGDLAGRTHHLVMSEIYQSMLERMCLDPGYSGSPLQ